MNVRWGEALAGLSERADMSNKIQELKNAFIDGLGIDPTGDFDSLAYGSTFGWDSVAHLALVSHIESRFDIMLTTDDVIAMSSFSKAKKILEKYGISFDS